MQEPVLILQTGEGAMKAETLACAFSDYRCIRLPFERLGKIAEEYRLKAVPVGSVEYVREWCRLTGLQLPSPLGYPAGLEIHLQRRLREGKFEEALPGEFVKPRENIKAFTGAIKHKVEAEVSAEEAVWISESVPFESEFRFYVHDFVTGPKIQGWARYDDGETLNPEPDFDLVEAVTSFYHNDLGPLAYSVDIGWRPDLRRYCLVEVNDAWSLGYYQNHDRQSNPPTRQQYADMLVSRWRQILFCNIVT